MKNWWKLLLIPVVGLLSSPAVHAFTLAGGEPPVPALGEGANRVGERAGISGLAPLHEASAAANARLLLVSQQFRAFPSEQASPSAGTPRPPATAASDDQNNGLLLMGGLMLGVLVVRRFPR